MLGWRGLPIWRGAGQCDMEGTVFRCCICGGLGNRGRFDPFECGVCRDVGHSDCMAICSRTPYRPPHHGCEGAFCPTHEPAHICNPWPDGVRGRGRQSTRLAPGQEPQLGPTGTADEDQPKGDRRNQPVPSLHCPQLGQVSAGSGAEQLSSRAGEAPPDGLPLWTTGQWTDQASDGRASAPEPEAGTRVKDPTETTTRQGPKGGQRNEPGPSA